jgi:very-long-chain enoyl-CoA reductase
MLLVHYIKRELESLFVHRFGKSSMPFFNIIKNSAHYWILGGLLIGFELFREGYHDPVYPKWIGMVLNGVFYFSETMNFRCHLALRNLRPANTKTKGIPHVPAILH